MDFLFFYPKYLFTQNILRYLKIARKQKRKNQGTPNKAPFVKKFSIWTKKWYTVSGLVNGPLRPRTHSRTLYVP